MRTLTRRETHNGKKSIFMAWILWYLFLLSVRDPRELFARRGPSRRWARRATRHVRRRSVRCPRTTAASDHRTSLAPSNVSKYYKIATHYISRFSFMETDTRKSLTVLSNKICFIISVINIVTVKINDFKLLFSSCLQRFNRIVFWKYIFKIRPLLSTITFSCISNFSIRLSISSSSSRPENPLSLAKNSKCSCTVSSLNNTLCCEQRPMWARARGICVVILYPATHMLPRVTSTLPKQSQM